MPTLTLIFRGQTLAFELAKIDRDRLYGSAATETTDAQGRPCSRATLAADGRTLAGTGDTAIAYLSPDGLWRNRSELRAVDATDGLPVVAVKTTFAFPMDLTDRETTLDDYLAHSVRLVYHLVPADDADQDRLYRLLVELEGGTIYRFPFSYRGGDLPSAGFLLLGSDRGVYLAVGEPCALDWSTLQSPAPLVADEEELLEEEEELDFSMV